MKPDEFMKYVHNYYKQVEEAYLKNPTDYEARIRYETMRPFGVCAEPAYTVYKTVNSKEVTVWKKFLTKDEACAELKNLLRAGRRNGFRYEYVAKDVIAYKETSYHVG